MTQEIAQLDELKLKPLSSGMRPKKCIQTDIGEVQVTRTIFGRAKVRIVRKIDRVRRSWLLTVMAVFTVLAATHQGWTSIQQARVQQSAVTKVGWSFAEPIKSLAAPPVSAALLDAVPETKNKPAARLQRETRNTFVAQKNTNTQQPIEAPEPVAVKPAVPQPLPEPKPQAVASTAAVRPVAATTPVPATIPAAATTPVASITTATAATTVPPAYKPLAASGTTTVTPSTTKASFQAAAPAVVTAPPAAAASSAYKPLAASSLAASTPPIVKTSPPVQEAANSVTTGMPPAAETPPPRMVATSISAAVTPPIVEPPSAQSTASVVQQEMPASEPGKGD